MNLSNANRQFALRFFDAINNNDPVQLLQLLDPNVMWVVPKTAAPPYAGVHTGAETITQLMLSAVEGAFDDHGVHHEVLLTVAEGDYVVAETRMRGTTTGGAEYDNQYVFIFRISGGCIVEIREHVDTAYAVSFFS